MSAGPQRRPGIVPGRRAALVAVLLLGVCAPGAAADNSSQQIEANVSGPVAPGLHTTTVGQLEGSGATACPTYGGGDYTAGGNEWPTGQIWSVSAVLTCLLGAQAAQVNEVIVHQSTNGADGGALENPLAPGDLLGTSYPNGEQPVIASDGTNVLYYRPAASASDDAAADYVVDSGEPFVMDVFTGPPLTVTASADPTTVSAGATVGFSASVSGGTANVYSWNFAGAAPAANGPDPTITIPAGASNGTYDVAVEVGNTQTGAAGYAQVPITVTGGTTPPPAATTTSATTTAPPQATTGAASTPRPAPTRTTKGHSGTSSGRHGTRPTRTTTASSSTTTTARSTTTTTARSATSPTPAPTRTTTSATTPAPTTTTSSPPARPTTTSHSRRAAHRPAPRHRARTRRVAPASHAVGTRVSGRLVADIVALPAGESPLVHTVRASPAGGAVAVSAVQSTPVSWPALAGAIAVVLGLLGAGAARERRSRRGTVRRRRAA